MKISITKTLIVSAVLSLAASQAMARAAAVKTATQEAAAAVKTATQEAAVAARTADEALGKLFINSSRAKPQLPVRQSARPQPGQALSSGTSTPIVEVPQSGATVRNATTKSAQESFGVRVNPPSTASANPVVAAANTVDSSLEEVPQSCKLSFSPENMRFVRTLIESGIAVAPRQECEGLSGKALDNADQILTIARTTTGTDLSPRKVVSALSSAYQEVVLNNTNPTAGRTAVHALACNKACLGFNLPNTTCEILAKN